KTPPSLSVRYEHGDMSDYHGGTGWDLAIVPYSSYLILQSDEKRLDCLSVIAHSIGPGGRAIIDNSPNFLLHKERTRAFALSGLCTPLRAHVTCYETVRQDPQKRVTHFRKDFEIEPEGDLRKEAHV